MTGNDRRAIRSGEPAAPPVERDGDVVTVRALGPARQMLRARDLTTQAGFTAESIPTGYLKHHPILMSDGPLHDEQRRRVARFFAPVVVHQRYADRAREMAATLLAAAAEQGTFLLDEVALDYTVAVTAEVVGLTESSVPAMARRLVTFFKQPPFDLTKPRLGRSPRQWAQAAVNGLWPVVRFYAADVRRAVAVRRRSPRDDVISHLIEQGYTDVDILVECVTYGTAGMVTTREFIAMAAWHLLTDADLRRTYRQGDTDARLAVLNEIMRLEPVVGHLYRRAQADFVVSDAGQECPIRRGDLIDVSVRPANADPSVVGAEPLRLRPGRSLPAGVNATGLAFGDGAHKCPGQPLALMEAEIFLTRLLGQDPVVIAEPEVGWDDLIAGYTVRDLRIRLGTPEAAQSG
ncbi:MAG: cytochrome P450 [Propioniciclava sp.]